MKNSIIIKNAERLHNYIFSLEGIKKRGFNSGSKNGTAIYK